MPEWLQNIGPWFSLIAMVCQPVFALGLFFLRKSFVSVEKFEVAIETTTKEVQAQCKRLDALETKVKNINQPDIHPLEIRLSELAGDIKTLTKSIDMQGEAMNKMEATTSQAVGRIEKQVNMLMQKEMGVG